MFIMVHTLPTDYSTGDEMMKIPPPQEIYGTYMHFLEPRNMNLIQRAERSS